MRLQSTFCERSEAGRSNRPELLRRYVEVFEREMLNAAWYTSCERYSVWRENKLSIVLLRVMLPVSETEDDVDDDKGPDVVDVAAVVIEDDDDDTGVDGVGDVEVEDEVEVEVDVESRGGRRRKSSVSHRPAMHDTKNEY